MNKQWATLAFKNIFRNRRRSLLTGLAVATVAAAMMMMLSFIAGMNSDLEVNLKALETSDILIQNKDFERYQVFNPLGYMIDGNEVKNILADEPNIKIYSRTLLRGALYLGDESYSTQIMAFASDDTLIKDRLSVDTGSYPTLKNEAAISRNLAKNRGLTIGDKIMVLSGTVGRGSNAVSYSITGIINIPTGGYNDNTIITTLEGATWLIKSPLVSKVIVTALAGQNINNLSASFNKSFADSEFLAKTWLSTYLGVAVQIQQRFFNFIVLLFFLLGGTVIINTSMMAIMERKKEIGVMRALGTSIMEVRLLFFLESITLSLIGTLVGLSIGTLLSIPFTTGTGFLSGDDSKAILEGFYLANGVRFKITGASALRVLNLSMLIAVIVAVVPTGRVARMKVSDSLRSQN